MPKDYNRLIENVKSRSNPSQINESELFQKSFNDELGQLRASGSRVLEYVKRSMKSVDQQYTSNTIIAGEKVRDQLMKNNSSLDFRFQGSVMSNTHIKGYSDIDLIQITNSFYFHENVENFRNKFYTAYGMSDKQSRNLLNVMNGTPYSGSEINNLREIRINAEDVLTRNYKYVKTSKSKSIEVNLTYPERLVDVVTASWYKTVDSEFNDNEIYKGVQVYDKDSNSRLPVDYPFLKIALLDKKNNETNGRLKRMIRFLKTLKADSDQNLKEFSSFDICSVCYNIPAQNYIDFPYYQLVYVLNTEFNKILLNENYRNEIKSIDGTEYIFYNKLRKVEQLRLLSQELSAIYYDLLPSVPTLKYL